MSRSEPTYIGDIQNVTGAVLSIRLRDDMSSALLLINGESHRVGQVGSFVRIPMGYANLYAVCTQIGAAAVPGPIQDQGPGANRWMTATLFGEAIASSFERGVSQHPTISDEVHLVTTSDLEIIYTSTKSPATLEVGTLGSARSIPGMMDLPGLVSRHCAVVGSTGSGKSNAVAVILEAIASQGYPSARVLVLDPHGEYAAVVGENGYVFGTNRLGVSTQRPLNVPYWALPFDEFQSLVMGPMQQGPEAEVRDIVRKMKCDASAHLASPPPVQAITADSPIPFSAKQLWFDLDNYERMTLQNRNPDVPATRVVDGNPEELISNQYPPPSPGGAAPFLSRSRGISRQLDLMRSRLLDSRFAFLLEPGPDLTPSLDGQITGDLATLVASWVGHDRQVSVLDLSGLPSEVMSTVAGPLLGIVYDTLYWASGTPVSGRAQPLLIIIEEAHRILPAGGTSPAHRMAARIVKEGRKHGVGLLAVTQRPTEVDPTILSQCGTLVALRVSNSSDRSSIAAAMPDDLGGLVSMLPALRTGEGLVMGEAMPVPTRIRFRRASRKPVGDDPDVASAWRAAQRPDAAHYAQAIENWLRQAQATHGPGSS